MQIVLKRIAKKKTYTIGRLYILKDEDVKKHGEGLDLTGIQVVDPATSDKTAAYIDKLVELRSKNAIMNCCPLPGRSSSMPIRQAFTAIRSDIILPRPKSVG